MAIGVIVGAAIGGLFLLVSVIGYIIAMCSEQRSNAVYPVVRQRRNDGNVIHKLVQIYLPVKAANGFYTELEKVLSVITIKCKLVEDRTNLDPSLPLIVICPINSRLESDVDAALYGIEWRRMFLAIVVHYGREDSVQWMSSSTLHVDREKFLYTVFVDIAYTVEEGLTFGPRNQKALVAIAAFLDSISNN